MSCPFFYISLPPRSALGSRGGTNASASFLQHKRNGWVWPSFSVGLPAASGPLLERGRSLLTCTVVESQTTTPKRIDSPTGRSPSSPQHSRRLASGQAASMGSPTRPRRTTGFALLLVLLFLSPLASAGTDSRRSCESSRSLIFSLCNNLTSGGKCFFPLSFRMWC